MISAWVRHTDKLKKYTKCTNCYWFIFILWLINYTPCFYQLKTLRATNNPSSHEQHSLSWGHSHTNTRADTDLYSSTASRAAWSRDAADSLCKRFGLSCGGSSNTYLCLLKEFMLQQLWWCWPEKEQRHWISSVNPTDSALRLPIINL